MRTHDHRPIEVPLPVLPEVDETVAALSPNGAAGSFVFPDVTGTAPNRLARELTDRALGTREAPEGN